MIILVDMIIFIVFLLLIFIYITFLALSYEEHNAGNIKLSIIYDLAAMCIFSIMTLIVFYELNKRGLI
jgi:hypothetical protein